MRIWTTLVPLALLAGCIGVSEKRLRPTASAAAPKKAAVAGAGIKTCAGETRPADDGELDDFEDRDTQLSRFSGRDGYWWTKKDEQGSTVNPKPLRTEEPGAGGSTRALHVTGETSGADGAWGAGVGVNLTTRGPYDASRYAGVAFKAKLGDKSTRRFRFKIGDVNTHKDAAICTDCWNHFGADMEYTTEWKEYKVLFAEVAQEQGWGRPRPPALLPDKLWSLDWSIGPGGLAYDLWVDDIVFLDCK